MNFFLAQGVEYHGAAGVDNADDGGNGRVEGTAAAARYNWGARASGCGGKNLVLKNERVRV